MLCVLDREPLVCEHTDHQSAHQRLIALSQSTMPVTNTITHLLSYLDTFYSDPSGWSLLADLYAEQGLYGQAISALGHLMVLQTWDSEAVRKSGELAYTIG
jgi:predicted Zn-dependent protease